MVKRIRKQVPKKRRTSRSGMKQFIPEINVNKMEYRGPIIPRQTLESNITETAVLIQETALSSTAGAVIANVFGNSPSSAANWADYNTVYGEYRTLGMRLEYFPTNRYSKTTTTCRLLAVADDRRNSTAYGSYAAICSHQSVRKHSLEDPWRHEIKMSGPEEAQFLAVNGPVSNSWIKLYADGLSVSTEYGILLVYYLVQFRNPE